MKRSVVGRIFASVLLLVQGSAVGAYAVLDGAVAARANASVAHVEEAGGRPSCIAHDESTCQLCRAGTTTPFVVGQHVVIAALVRADRPADSVGQWQGSIAHPALHSRAPPVA